MHFFKAIFLRFSIVIIVCIVCILRARVVAFEVEVLLGVCWFVVDICDDLAIYVFL